MQGVASREAAVRPKRDEAHCFPGAILQMCRKIDCKSDFCTELRKQER